MIFQHVIKVVTFIFRILILQKFGISENYSHLREFEDNDLFRISSFVILNFRLQDFSVTIHKMTVLTIHFNATGPSSLNPQTVHFGQSCHFEGCPKDIKSYQIFLWAGTYRIPWSDKVGIQWFQGTGVSKLWNFWMTAVERGQPCCNAVRPSINIFWIILEFYELWEFLEIDSRRWTLKIVMILYFSVPS